MESLLSGGGCVFHTLSSTSPQGLRDEITSVAGEALEDNGGFSPYFSHFFVESGFACVISVRF